jgi:hypothetical protein
MNDQNCGNFEMPPLKICPSDINGSFAPAFRSKYLNET